MTLQHLVLWRHGETEYNVSGRIQGQLDIELSSTGASQAKRAAPVVAAFEPDVVLSSDLRRAADTAASYTEVTGTLVPTDARLRETHLGDWQGLSGAEVEQHWPGQLAAWRVDPWWEPPGGESRVRVAERASEVVAELDARYSGTALLCAHGGLITGLVSRLLELPAEHWPLFGGMANCHWTVLRRWDGAGARWRLVTYNTGLQS